MPDEQPQASQSLQLGKLILGGVLSIGCIAILAFEKKLGLALGDDVRMAILLGALGPGALSVHGALMMKPPGGQ
jgi:hypothetical protein